MVGGLPLFLALIIGVFIRSIFDELEIEDVIC